MDAHTPVCHVGIDLAVARAKRLPVCFLIEERPGRLVPLSMKELARQGVRPPLGLGDDAVWEDFHAGGGRMAEHAAGVVRFVEATLDACRERTGVRPRLGRLAVDAPCGFAAAPGETRACERALLEAGVRFYKTPARADVRPEGRAKLFRRVWMLYGVRLFETLRQAYPAEATDADGPERVLEVFPHLAWRGLGVRSKKSEAEGFAERAAKAKALAPGLTDDMIRECAYGAGHDRLDAWMCAWIAGRPADELVRYGQGPSDAVWTLRPKQTEFPSDKP